MSEPLNEWIRAPIPVPALCASAAAVTLTPLFEVNETALGLLAEYAWRTSQESTIAAAPVMIRSLHNVWCSLDAQAIQRAARCPVLLVDLDIWTQNKYEPKGPRPQPWCPRDKAVPLMRSALTLAWHLCRMHRQTAGVRLGLSPATVQLLQDLRLQQIDSLAESKSHLLRPRRENQRGFWRSLLLAAQAHSLRSQDDANLQALHLVLSDLLPPADARHGHTPPDSRGHNAQNQTNGPS